MKGSYFGPSYDNDEILNELKNFGAKYRYLNDKDLIKFVSSKLSNQKVFGWFQGKMEFGPRALGNRSIIADPRPNTMQKNLNLKIKFRESFRPFAPAVLKEEAKKWFDLDVESPYMLLVVPVKEEKRVYNVKNNDLEGLNKLNLARSIIPAVTHIDFSARVQTVDENYNRMFYNLIKEFYNITKVPMLVNTSFNIKDEPIVNTIEDAYKCFLISDMDYLVCGNYILSKFEQYD